MREISEFPSFLVFLVTLMLVWILKLCQFVCQLFMCFISILATNHQSSWTKPIADAFNPMAIAIFNYGCGFPYNITEYCSCHFSLVSFSIDVINSKKVMVSITPLYCQLTRFSLLEIWTALSFLSCCYSWWLLFYLNCFDAELMIFFQCCFQVSLLFREY